MSAGALLSRLVKEGGAGRNAPPGLISRNVTVRGRRTSMRLEASMWDALNEICRRECASAADICTRVAAAKSPALTLTAALRVFIARYFRDAATEEGHARAGHGREIPTGSLPPSVTAPTRIPGATAPGVTPAE
jgi:predicted DNA-binding ribbon-helix-helix protein